MDNINLNPEYLIEEYFSSESTDCVFKQILLACHEFMFVSELEPDCQKCDVIIFISSDLWIKNVSDIVIQMLDTMGFCEYKKTTDRFVFSSNGHNLIITRLPSARSKVNNNEIIYFYDPNIECMFASFFKDINRHGIKLSCSIF